ncbi:MAG TPA: pitrilysin family protein [Stellaceae bacterium]
MSVHLSKLSNGMRVVTDTMNTVETVSLGVYVEIGTRHEPQAINGVSHMLEHMAFKGTARRSALAIASEIEDVGGHLNAYTSREHTAYHAKVLKGDTALALDLLADILQRSVFDPAEMERERGVILQEIGQANDTPDDIIFDHFQETAFPGQRVGQPVLGRADIIRRMGRDTVANYMYSHYAASRMLLIAVGNIEHDELMRLAELVFAEMPARSDAPSEPAHYIGGDYREERDLEQAHLLLGFPGFSSADPDLYAASLVSTALGGGMSSRLFQEVREKRGLVYSVYSFASPFSDGGVFGIYAGTGADALPELIPVLAHEIHRLRDGFARDEFERARAQHKAGLLMALESPMSRVEQQAGHMLVFGTPFDPAELVRKIDAVDQDGVRRVATRLLSAPPTVAALGPVGALEPYARLVQRLHA